MDKQVISIDVGTSKVKVVKYKNQTHYYEEYHREDVAEILDHAIKQDYDAILLTGSGASEIDGEDYLYEACQIPIYRLNELECVANIVKAEGHNEGLVINIGTGTSFLYYNDGVFEHVTGTGIGGGTFEGLSYRLLHTKDPILVETLAKKGSIEEVNLVIKDIYKENLGWLQDDITVANFAKNGQNSADIAIGIHSLVIEPIMSMVKAFCHFNNLSHIYFTGGVMNNSVITELVDKYAKFFNINYRLLEQPSYGTARGALEVFWRDIDVD